MGQINPDPEVGVHNLDLGVSYGVLATWVSVFVNGIPFAYGKLTILESIRKSLLNAGPR